MPKFIDPLSEANSNPMDWGRRVARKLNPSIQGANGSASLVGAVGFLTRTIKHPNGNGLSASELEVIMIEEFNPRCIPPWTKSEIQRAIRNHGPGSNSAPKNPATKTASTKAKAIAAAQIEANAVAFAGRFVNASETDFRRLANVTIPESASGQTLAFLRTLYPSDALLAFAENKGGINHFLTAGEWIGLQEKGSASIGFECIKVNPFRDNTKASASNVASFEYCVMESDSCPLPVQLGVWLRMLHHNLPIVAITFSGAKSIHSVLRLGAETLEAFISLERAVHAELERLIPGFVDNQCKGAERRMRLPGGIRKDKENTLQRLIYLQDITKPDSPF